jgi:hypothetical protein
MPRSIDSCPGDEPRESPSGQTRSFDDVASMSGLRESGHGRVILVPQIAEVEQKRAAAEAEIDE